MLIRIIIAIGCYATAAVCLAQSSSLGASMGVMVFPAEGQDETQQSIDEAQCFSWAVDRSGSDPFQLSQQAAQQQADANAAMQQAQQAGQGSAARGVVTGALVGAAFGSSSRTTRRTAAVGGIVGSRRRSGAQSQATAEVEAQAAQQQAATEAQMTTFRNAFGACLEGLGYIAR